MQIRDMLMSAGVLFLTFTMITAIAEPACHQSGEGLRIYENNPRYFSFDGAPIFLASRSFGWTAISDHEFDYVRDIETMAAHGGNLLRLTLFWPSHGEEGGQLPWVRDEATGLYDLDEFNPMYFERLRHYIATARKHDAVVNLELFDHPAVKGGAARWPTHPMNPAKNVNYGEEVFGTSSADREFFRTLPDEDDNPVALRYQKALARKVIDETHDFDNVIYSLGNECIAPEGWNVFWVNYIRQYAAEIGRDNMLITNMWRHDLPVFDVFDIHDASSPFRVRRMNAAGMWESYQALAAQQQEQGRTKPVYDSGQMGGAPGSHILHQLWMSFVGGTAGMRYHRLAPVHPRPGVSSEVVVGDWEDPHYLQQQRWVKNLCQFIDGMAFGTMAPLWDAVTEGEGYVFGRECDEYVLYLPEGGGITATLPGGAGHYGAYWYNADTGEQQSPHTIDVPTDTERVSVTAPEGRDWVLHMKAST